MRALLQFSLAVGLANASAAADWPRWRGSDGQAIADDSPLPTRWDKAMNVTWKKAIPGEGFSSPIICKDRLFLTAARAGGTDRLVHCLDRDSGKLLWTGTLRHNDPERTAATTGHAAATPATDGQRIIAAFGNAGVVCYDWDGKQLWHQSLGTFDTELGLASSPMIYRDRGFLVCDHDGDRFSSFDSFLVALDVATGKILWKTDRRGLGRSWATPILVPAGADKQELIVSGQDHLRAYDPETGEQLWQTAGLLAWVAPSPVFGQGLVFAASGKNGPIIAVRPGGRGDVTASHVVWRKDHGGPYLTSPLLYGDYLYIVNEQAMLTCFEAKTGAVRYQQRLEGKFTASPVAGDGKVYCLNEDGVTFVVKAGPQYELLARNDLGEYCAASPALVGGAIYLRTERHLYCLR